MARIVILTGAGISAESGLGTFRDAGGHWTRADLAELATPEGFARDPGRVHDFYNMRRAQAAAAQPNAAHLALARLEAALPGAVSIVTQNVDDLHERAGSASVIHMHGRLTGARCAGCGARWEAPLRMGAGDPCPACAAPATRPDVVWFGEMPERMEEIARLLGGARLFAAIGTSGTVWPAAGFAAEAGANGAWRVEINAAPSAVAGDFDDWRIGPATEAVPEWVDEVIARWA